MPFCFCPVVKGLYGKQISNQKIPITCDFHWDDYEITREINNQGDKKNIFMHQISRRHILFDAENSML